jgi:hypothetical protein
MDELFSVLNKYISDSVSKVQDDLDKEMFRKATIAGQKAALDGDFERDPRNTIASNAFNKAGFETLINKSKVDLDLDLESLMLDPTLSHNPQALREKANSVIAKGSEGLPAELIPNYKLYAESKSNDLEIKANVNQKALLLDTNKAEFEKSQSHAVTRITNFAENGDLAALSREQALYISSLENQGPITLGGTGVLSQEDIASQINMMHKETRKNLVLGAFRRKPISGKMAFIKAFRNTNFAEEVKEASGVTAGSLTADDKRAIEDAMMSDLNAELASENKKEAKNKIALKRNADAAAGIFYENPADDKAFELAKELNPQKVGVYIKYREDRLAGSNPFQINEAWTRLHNGTLTREWLEEGLKTGSIDGSDFNSFLDRVNKREEEYPFVSWPSWNAEGGYLDRLKTDFPEKTDAFGRTIRNTKNAKLAQQIRNRVFDDARDQWKKFQNGEEGAERPDILRLYALTKNDVTKNFDSGEGGKKSELPSKYQDSPKLLADDIDSGLISKELGRKYKEILKNEKGK